MNQLPDLINHCRTAIAGESHNLVLVLIHPEAEIRGEGRVQHSQRMWKPDFAEQANLRSPICILFTPSDRKCRPFPYAISGQDCRAICRRGKEGRRSVRLMVLSE